MPDFASPTRLAGSRIAAGMLCVLLLLGAAPAWPQGGSDLVGTLQSYTARHDDTLAELARSFGFGYIELVAANPGVNAWLPGEGTEILLPSARLLPNAPRQGLLINLGELRLYLFDQDGALLASHPIGIGRQGFTTPLGDTTVVRKQKDPIWFPTASARLDNPGLPAAVATGPDNPLGSHALYLGWPTYLVHGTNKPWGVGRRVSRGCIRLYPEDIEQLYALVGVGVAVTVVHQPFKTGWHDGRLYLEVHPSETQGERIEQGEPIEASMQPGLNDAVYEAAGRHAARLDWLAIERAQIERRGIPVPVTPYVGG